MKIVFLCSSLAPGRDGVGDYTRQLAAACRSRGHTCLLVALHDRHLAATAPHEHRLDETRFSATLAWPRRAAQLDALLRGFSPDWLSWQIVPYGFDTKGVLPSAFLSLVDAARPWRSHVMLHELWIGLARGERLKARVIGALQRRRVRGFLQRLRPAALDTSNATYQLALAQAGWPAGVLPLFGNMPVLAVKSAAARAALTSLIGPALPTEPRWVGVLFGTIHPQWYPASTLAWLRSAAIEHRRRLELLAIGRPGVHGAKLLVEMARTHPDIPVIAAGAQSEEKISHLLHAVDFGLATHPWALIGKSGTTATLLEHGLPVLVPRDDWHSRHGAADTTADPLLSRLGPLAPSSFAAWLARRQPAASRLPAVADAFLSRLTEPAAARALVA